MVIRERVETVIDAVEEQTGHVGVTVLEAVGHGRERGITHEYRGRVFESRFLPKALLTFVVEDSAVRAVVDAIVDAARSGNEAGDGLVWSSPVSNVTHNRTGRANVSKARDPHRGQHRLGRGGGRPRHVHAGRVRLPRGRADADEERGAHRRQERPHLRRLLARLLGGRLRDRVQQGERGHRDRAGSSPPSTRCSRSGRRRSSSSPRSPARRATSSRSCSRASRWRSSGARWPSARSSGSTSRSGSPSPSSTRSPRTGSGAAAGSSAWGCRTSPARPSSTTRARSPRWQARSCSGRASGSSPAAAATRSRATTSRTPCSGRSSSGSAGSASTPDPPSPSSPATRSATSATSR